MKVDYQIVQKRRDDIMMIIQKLGDVTVKQLMNDFNVSEITIRRDLQYWEDRGAIIRFHGGAKIVQHMVDHDNSDFTNERYKHAIAKMAASYIEDGDTVFIIKSTSTHTFSNHSSNAICDISDFTKRDMIYLNGFCIIFVISIFLEIKDISFFNHFCTVAVECSCNCYISFFHG